LYNIFRNINCTINRIINIQTDLGSYGPDFSSH